MSERRPKRRVTLLCQHFYPEMISTGLHMTELARSLRKLDWEVTVYCAQPSLSLETDEGRVPAEMEYEGIRIVRMPTMGTHSKGLWSRLAFGVSYLVSTLGAVFRHRASFDGLLITTNPPFLGLVGCIASVLLKKPYVLIVYDVYPDIAVQLGFLKANSPLTYLWEHVSRWMLETARAVVVIGRDMAEIVKEKLGREHGSKVHLIPNWSDEQVVRPIPHDENTFRSVQRLDGRLLVQYSGRMGTTHNLEPLLEAATRLREAPIMFQFIGDGAKKQQLKELAAQKNLDNVQFLPYQPLDRLGDVLSAADLAVVCLESKFTGLSVPSKTYGVMASGTPILGFLEPHSEIGRTIRENKCGIVLKDPTGRQVAEVLRELSEQPEYLREMGINGYDTFKSNYTLTLAAQRYSALMERCFYQTATE